MLCVCLIRHLAYGVPPFVYFCHPSQVLHLYPTGCKIHFHSFFLSLHWPAKIYLSQILSKLGSYCSYVWSEDSEQWIQHTDVGKVTDMQFNSEALIFRERQPVPCAWPCSHSFCHSSEVFLANHGLVISQSPYSTNLFLFPTGKYP
jgi:hypothetical protein